MTDPLFALVIFGALVALVGLVFWPRRGLAPRALSLFRLTERVRFEDVLKHLYHCEYANRRGTVDSVAGALEISRARAFQLLERLQSLKSVKPENGEFALTEEGRADALRIVRSHRLWERYLADRTNLRPAEWHEEAERLEHTLTPDAADQLAARMGDPRYDPHGDPIPTSQGVIPPQQGVPLTELSSGDAGSIVHLEDEPKEVYDRLIQEGLSPQMQLQVTDSTPEEVRFTVEGREHTLAPVVAGNVTVNRVPSAEVIEETRETLWRLDMGEVATVTGLSPACQGPQRRRLLDLGLVPGTRVTVEMRSPLRDPVAYRVRGAVIALRRHQADWVQVERSPVPAGTEV
jgi:DtxR family Mn-dependent transcriptional regulator